MDKLSPDFRAIILKKLGALHPRLLYLFGSAAQGTAGPESDLDLAFLSSQTVSPLQRHLLAEDLAVEVRQDVDLVDLALASDVLKAQILKTGILLHATSETERNRFEMYALSDFARLNDERRPVLQSIQRDGRIYGR